MTIERVTGSSTERTAQKLKEVDFGENFHPIEDAEIEVEYQSETVGKYDLNFNGNHFVLKNKQTACLASDACGIPAEKQKVKLSELNNACCTPNSGCC